MTIKFDDVKDIPNNIVSVGQMQSGHVYQHVQTNQIVIADDYGGTVCLETGKTFNAGDYEADAFVPVTLKVEVIYE